MRPGIRVHATQAMVFFAFGVAHHAVRRARRMTISHRAMRAIQWKATRSNKIRVSLARALLQMKNLSA
jgi:hypothetical protein